MFPRPPPALYAEQQTHKATLAPPPHPHALFSDPFFCTAMLNQRAEQTWGARSSPALFNVCNYANLWRRLSVETKDESVSIPGEPTAPQPAQQKSSLTCQIGLLSAGGFLLAASTPERGIEATAPQLNPCEEVKQEARRPSLLAPWWTAPVKERLLTAGNETWIEMKITAPAWS